MRILKNAEIKMNLQKKREQDDATQMKKKTIAFKGTQDESSSEESTNEDDLAYVIKKANKMIRKKFNKRRNFQRSNGRKDETGSINCSECNKPGHIKKDYPNLKEKTKKFFKKKALYIGWDESEPSDSENEEKDKANLSISNENVCFMADNQQVTLDDYITSDEIEYVYIKLVADYKKLSKRFTTLKNEHASYPSIYENILREKNELLVKIVKLQIENVDLKIR